MIQRERTPGQQTNYPIKNGFSDVPFRQYVVTEARKQPANLQGPVESDFDKRPALEGKAYEKFLQYQDNMEFMSRSRMDESRKLIYKRSGESWEEAQRARREQREAQRANQSDHQSTFNQHEGETTPRITDAVPLPEPRQEPVRIEPEVTQPPESAAEAATRREPERATERPVGRIKRGFRALAKGLKSIWNNPIARRTTLVGLGAGAMAAAVIVAQLNGHFIIPWVNKIPELVGNRVHWK